MIYSDFEIALSKPRLGRFLLAADGDRNKALWLYKLNIQLSKTLFGILGIFEITLRNRIDQHYRNLFNDVEWLKSNCLKDGIFSHASFSKYGFETKIKILATIAQLGKRYNHDRLVAELSFGFWTYMFAPIQFAAGGQGVHKIYIHRPKATSQKLLFNQLDEIRSLRNRIAHHEPLCFNRQHRIFIHHTQMIYDNLIKQTTWMGFDPKKLYMGLDKTLEIIAKIEKLI